MFTTKSVCVLLVLITSLFVLSLGLFQTHAIPLLQVPASVTCTLVSKQVFVGELPRVRLRVVAPSDRPLMVANPNYPTLGMEISSLELLGDSGSVEWRGWPKLNRHILPGLKVYQRLPPSQAIEYDFSVWGIPRKEGDYRVLVSCTVDQDRQVKYEGKIAFTCSDLTKPMIGSSVAINSVHGPFEAINAKTEDGWLIFLRSRTADGSVRTRRFLESDDKLKLLEFRVAQSPVGQEFTAYHKLRYSRDGVNYAWYMSEYGDIASWEKE